MKYLIYLFYLLLSFSCSNSDDNPKNNVPQELIGKWKVVEIYSSDGSTASWSPFDSGESYDIWFKENRTVVFIGNSENCRYASYSVSNNNIYYSGNPCTTEEPIYIELLTNFELTLDLNSIEPYKSKFIKLNE